MLESDGLQGACPARGAEHVMLLAQDWEIFPEGRRQQRGGQEVGTGESEEVKGG